MRGLLDDPRLQIFWNLPRALLPKNRVKLLLNLILIASSAVPRGGKLTIDPVGEGEALGFRITAEGSHAKIQPAVEALLINHSADGVDAHTIQPHYTSLLAGTAGLKLSLESAPEKIVLAAA